MPKACSTHPYNVFFSNFDEDQLANNICINIAGKSTLKLGNLPSLKVVCQMQAKIIAPQSCKILQTFVWRGAQTSNPPSHPRPPPPNQTSTCKIRLWRAISLLLSNESHSHLASKVHMLVLRHFFSAILMDFC